MNTHNEYISYWLRRFLLEYAITVRNLSKNTLLSYRDTFKLLLPYLSKMNKIGIEKLSVNLLTRSNVQDFLRNLEISRNVSPASRNQRLTSILTFAKYLSTYNPEYAELYRELKFIPMKKHQKPMIGYLERDEIEALLDAPDKTTQYGYRDYVIILFMYNTGARADEVSKLTVADYDHNTATVILHGKGNKTRKCPLWKSANREIHKIVKNLACTQNIFTNRHQAPLTRFGIYGLITKHAAEAAKKCTSLRKKNVTPHVIRHTTATHLLQSGVDINTIRAWLGHVSVNTTNVYAEVSMKAKSEALDCCEVHSSVKQKCWKENPDVMAFLNGLYK